MSHTHTYAILEISQRAHDEIAAKLRAAGYAQAFHEDNVIDLDGIAVQPAPIHAIAIARSTPRESHEAAGLVTHDEARGIRRRFNASHFGHGEVARYSIPADPKRDDDIRLGAYIARQERIELAAHALCARINELQRTDAGGVATAEVNALVDALNAGKPEGG